MPSLKALKRGALMPTTDTGVSKYDFTHLLPPAERESLRLVLKDTHKWGQDIYVRVLEEDGNIVGRLDGMYNLGIGGLIRSAKLENATLDDPYWGRGIGKAMYLAFYVHVLKVHKITKVHGWTHSTMAARVHTSLTRDYGLCGYQPKRTTWGWGDSGAYDNAWGPYTYKLA